MGPDSNAMFLPTFLWKSYLFVIKSNNRTTALGVYSVLTPKDLVGSSLIGWLKL
jgi:hypothetical protein